MTPAEVLRGAAQVIRERGWCQFRYEDERGACCAAGAINVAVSGDAYMQRSSDEARALRYLAVLEAEKATASNVTTLTGWNDVGSRTVEEVLAMLERAAEAAA